MRAAKRVLRCYTRTVAYVSVVTLMLLALTAL